MLRFKSLGSGSTGNCTLVEASSEGHRTRALVDCGMGLRQLNERLAKAGLGLADIDLIFVTHEHSDHVGCAVSLAQKQGIPLWLSKGSYRAIGEPDLGDLLHLAQDHVRIEHGELQLLPFTVPHDAREPLQLRCTDGQVHLGLLTDLGHVTPHVLDSLAHCHALLLESNHDPELLAASRYPAFLKKRVAGPFGHLANAVAAQAAQALKHSRLSTVVAAHLSLQNNRPDLARAALAQGLGCAPDEVLVADALDGTDWLTVA